jgi:hypothetical protein
VPFHLKTMGGNALGMYVCQFGLVSVLWNSGIWTNGGGYFLTLQNIQSKEYLGDGYAAGLVQLFLVYSVPLVYFWVFGDMCMAYVMAPLHWATTAATRLARLWRVWGRGGLLDRVLNAVRRESEGEQIQLMSEKAPLL